MGKWVKVHPREEKQVGRRFNLLPQHRKWLPAGSGEPPDLHHLVSRSPTNSFGEREEERSDCGFLFYIFVVFIFCFPRSSGAGGGAALLLLQQQETMWGQGLQGLKVTNLLGFLWPGEAQKSANQTRPWLIKEKKQQKLVRYVRAVPLCGASLQRVQQRLVEKHEGNTRSHERIGRTTAPPPLFLLPKLHKDKDKPAHTLIQKDALTISCMVIFCPYKSSSRRTGRWPQRGDVCGRKVRFDVVASFFAFKGGKWRNGWMNENLTLARPRSRPHCLHRCVVNHRVVTVCLYGKSPRLVWNVSVLLLMRVRKKGRRAGSIWLALFSLMRNFQWVGALRLVSFW